MVSSKGRRLLSRLETRSIDVSPRNPKKRRSRSQLSAAHKETAHHTAAAASLSGTLPSISAAEPTRAASSSGPLLLGCHACLKGKDAIRKPVVTFCGHLFCWRCLLDRIPADDPCPEDVSVHCPVCDTPLWGGSSNRTLNSIIPAFGENEPATDCIESDDEPPLPQPNAFPIWILDEKVQMFHDTAQKFKSAEDHFASMRDQTRETRISIDKCMQQIMKSINRQASTSADAVSEQIMNNIDRQLSISSNASSQ